MNNKLTRRQFLSRGTLGLAGLMAVPHAMGDTSTSTDAPKRKLNIAGVGVGGRGAGVLRNMETENIVALCDVDWKYAANTFKRYPKAKKYKDFRKMFDEMGKDIDAVVIATSDHTHAIIAAEAMVRGIHVYCEKPLTHTVYESRLLTKLAAHHGVATQMGDQGASAAGIAMVCDLIWNGEIGEVTKVESFTDRPIWPQGLTRPEKVESIPDTLDWDLFIGPAPVRPYNSIYTPWNWRGWWDFGTGALGDMAIHLLHVVYRALKLGHPISAQGSSTPLLTECAPNAERVHLKFPARKALEKIALPEVELIWYDGGLQPSRPEGLDPGINLNMNGGCTIFHGTKDTLICGCYGHEPILVSGRKPKVPQRHPVCKLSHEQDFVRAAKEPKEKRVPTLSDFSVAGPLNEIVVMGVLAVRLQALNKELMWDGDKMKFTNIGPDEQIKIMTKDGFSIEDGHPTFDKEYTDPISALDFANEMIKHTYREGWTLPPMPQ